MGRVDRSRVLLLAGVLGVTALLGCGEDDGRGGAFDEHEEASDLEPYSNEKFDGPLETFVPDLVVDDALFQNSDAVTVEAMQDLLEVSPYGKRSFLADEMVGGKKFSQVLVDVAKAHQLNPVLLLVRMQVEKSLVSKTTRPGGNSVDFALGCGCPDGRSCNEAFRGLDKQLTCGAQTLRKHFDASVAGTGQWKVGSARSTLDPRSITPRSHATASLYAYTPWVLEGKGGNWLVWNVTRKYIGTMLDRGTYDIDEMMPDPVPGAQGSCADHCGSTSAVPVGDGTSCFCDDECEANGDCCEDYADQCGGGEDTGSDDTGSEDTGSADTGSEDTGTPGGSCVGYCGDQSPVDDGAGGSCYCDATCELSGDCCSDYVDVCTGAPEGPSCAGYCGSGDPIEGDDGSVCYCDELCSSNGDCCGDYDIAC